MISFILSYSALIIAYNYFWFTKSKVYVQQSVFVCLKCIVFTCTNCHIIIQILDFDFRTRIDALSISVVLFTNEKWNCLFVLFYIRTGFLKSVFILIHIHFSNSLPLARFIQTVNFCLYFYSNDEFFIEHYFN